MPDKTSRLFAAAPDALTAALYLIAWFAPTLIGSGQVRGLMLTMAVECVVMMSSGFFYGIALQDAAKRRRQIGLTVALVLFYFAFIGGLAWQFHSLWPLFAFVWLLLSRFLPLWLGRGSDVVRDRLFWGWTVSMALFFAGGFVTTLLPLPRLGLTPAVVQSLDLHGKSMEQPWMLLAFGAIYFGAQAWAKYSGIFATPGRPTSSPSKP